MDQTKVPVGNLRIVNISDMMSIIADQSHIIGICHNHREIFPVDRLQLFRDKHAYHLAARAKKLPMLCSHQQLSLLVRCFIFSSDSSLRPRYGSSLPDPHRS